MAESSHAPPPPSPAQPARPIAQPPAGSVAQPGADEVLYHGLAKQSAYFVSYAKWTAVCGLGGVLAFALNQLDFIASSGLPVWVLVLAGTPMLLWTWLVARTTRFKITRRRVETERGVLSRTVDSLELWRVVDVQYHQTLLDRLLDNGSVVLIGTDQTHPKLELHGLPGHRQLFEKLRDAVQLARQHNRPMEFVTGQDQNPGVVLHDVLH